MGYLDLSWKNGYLQPKVTAVCFLFYCILFCANTKTNRAK